MVEHHLAMVGVAGSNPVFRSKIEGSPSGESFLREIAQFGRALRSGRRGRRFKSDFPDIQAIRLGSFFLFVIISFKT